MCQNKSWRLFLRVLPLMTNRFRSIPRRIMSPAAGDARLDSDAAGESRGSASGTPGSVRLSPTHYIHTKRTTVRLIEISKTTCPKINSNYKLVRYQKLCNARCPKSRPMISYNKRGKNCKLSNALAVDVRYTHDRSLSKIIILDLNKYHHYRRVTKGARQMSQCAY